MKYLSIYLLIGVALFSSSCKKFLENQPLDGQVNGDLYWTSENAAQNFLNGTYATLRSALRTPGAGRVEAFYAHGSIRTDEWERLGPSKQALQKYIDNYCIAVDGRAWTNWRPFYSVVSQTNLLIDQLNKMDDGLFKQGSKQQLMAQALFLRAFTYFYMVRVWGDVPAMYTPIYAPRAVPDIPRTSQQDILDNCINDLETAVAGLSWTATQSKNRDVKATKGAAYSCLAHIYAWRHEWLKAEDACNQVINSGQYALVNTTRYLDLYIPNTAQKETIFVIPFRNEDGEAYQSGFVQKTLGIVTDVTIDPDADPGQEEIGEGVEEEEVIEGYIQLHRDNLARLYKQYRKVPDSVNADLYQIDTSYSDVRIGLFFDWDTTRPAVAQGIRLAKYAGATIVKPALNKAGAVYWSQTPYIIFRLADIILLKAEVLERQQKYNEARLILNQMLTRVNRMPFEGADEELLMEIIEERERELIGEGQRMYDLVRTRLLPQVKNNYSSDDGSFIFTMENFARGAWYMPVDPEIINTEKLIKQTPFWQGAL